MIAILRYNALILGVCSSTLLAMPALAQEDDGERADAKAPAVPSVAADTPSGTFGARKQLAISSDAGLSISNTSVSGVDGSTTELTVRPAVDYFVIDNLSLGGFLGLDYMSTPGGESTSFSVGPRVGYNIPFSARFSVWPKVGFSIAATSMKTDDVEEAGIVIEGEDSSNTSLALNLFAPVMFHPVEHFFLGFGPALDADLTGDAKTITVAGRLTIGGWM